MTYRDDEAARRALRAERLQTLATRIAAIESWERDLERVDASVPDRPASLAEESSQRPRTVDDETPLDDAVVEASSATRTRTWRSRRRERSGEGSHSLGLPSESGKTFTWLARLLG